MKTHVWKNVPGSEASDHSLPVRKIRFKEIAKAVKFTSNLFGKALSKRIKATILFASETGKSELYAKRLAQIFSHAFNVSVSLTFFSLSFSLSFIPHYSYAEFNLSCVRILKQALSVMNGTSFIHISLKKGDNE